MLKCEQDRAKCQRSKGSWKTWKVLEFYFDVFEGWKVLEICLFQAVKFSEYTKQEMYVNSMEN